MSQLITFFENFADFLSLCVPIIRINLSTRKPYLLAFELTSNFQNVKDKIAYYSLKLNIDLETLLTILRIAQIRKGDV